jgi:CIC family chloride channel protein
MIGRRITAGRILVRLRRIVRNDHLILSVLALVVGAAGGGAIIVFREGIDLTQMLFCGSAAINLYAHAQDLPWWRLLLAPAAGGLMVGLLVYYVMPDRRP